jgi:Ni/Co efflux regulator RcnB
MASTDTEPIRAYTETQAEAVRRDRAAGLTREKLREKYGYSKHTIEDMLWRRGAYAPQEER